MTWILPCLKRIGQHYRECAESIGENREISLSVPPYQIHDAAEIADTAPVSARVRVQARSVPSSTA